MCRAARRASYAGIPTASGCGEQPTSRPARGQDRILDALWPLLARGGKMLYATCSLFAEENEGRIASFLARHTEALRETITFPADVPHTGGQLLPSPSAAVHNQDGFFYALLRKA
jgi:16S rRNA (cytosine967-C5)-methyltransferase